MLKSLMKKISFLIFIFFLSLPSQASDSLYFARTFMLINQQFDSGNYEANIKLIERLVHEPEFKELNCHHQGQIYHKTGGAYYFLNQEQKAIEYYKLTFRKRKAWIIERNNSTKELFRADA